MIRRLLSAAAATLLLSFVVACKPPTPTPTTSPLPGPSSHGYLIRITILDRNGEQANRDVDCTVAAYSGKSPILVQDPKTGRKQPYRLTVTLPYPVESTVHIYDPPSAADRISYVCFFNGLVGESIDCEASAADTGKLAPLFSSQDFDLITKAARVGSCFGEINAKERL